MRYMFKWKEEYHKSTQSKKMIISSPSRLNQETQVSSEVLVPFTAQCVDSFGRLSQHGHAMWPDARLELIKSSILFAYTTLQL